MNVIQKHIRSLAVSYSAYNAANSADDYSGVVVWGELLLADQEATGVELHKPERVRAHIASCQHVVARSRPSTAFEMAESDYSEANAY